MTVEEVKARVEKIRSIANDDEMAHSAEDDLRRAVLVAIVNDKTHAQELAKAALETSHIEFERWCA